jgi:hypothetical protein
VSSWKQKVIRQQLNEAGVETRQFVSKWSLSVVGIIENGDDAIDRESGSDGADVGRNGNSSSYLIARGGSSRGNLGAKSNSPAIIVTLLNFRSHAGSI